MTTSDFPYLNFTFDNFNPIQEKCINYYNQDCNLVVSATMASGKTTIAEMVLSFEIAEKGSKCVYVSPLCELTEEIKNKWCRYPLFSNNIDKLNFYTVEGLDVAIRKKYIDNIDCLIFDEAQIIDNDGRGANAEVLIMKIAQSMNCRIIILSGTMSNATEIAKWLKSLNNKKTFVISSNWRPVEIIKNKIIYTDDNDKFNKLLDILQDSIYEKIVIFVYSKNVGKELKKKLLNNGYFSEFISSDLHKNKIRKIIRTFQNNNSGLDILISTSVIGQGVNL